MELEIRGSVTTGFDGTKFQNFIGLENNLLPRK
jgi:hypothetical protein